MTRTEELLRAATRESAASVQRDSVPPMRPRGARQASLRAAIGLGWRRGLVLPVVAAVLVVAVVALSVSLPRLLRASGSATPTTSGPVTPSGIPRYYIAASGPWEAHGDLQPVDALVMDSQTGAVLATVKPPAGYSSFALFGGGAASGEEFVVAAQKGWKPILDPDFRYYESNDRQPITFFILRFDPATGQVTLQKMSDLQVGFLPSAEYYAPGPGGNQVTEQQVSALDVRGFALSPDGTQLAVLTDGWTPDGKSQVTTIDVLPVTAGAAARSWQLTVNGKTTPGNIYSVSGGLGLSWSSDGKFLETSNTVTASTVLMLNTTLPGDSLLADSRLLTLSQKVPPGVAGNRLACGWDLVLTDDGTEIACPALIQHVYPNTGNQPGSPHFNLRTYKNAAALSTAIATFSTASGDLVSLAAVTPYRTYGASYPEGIGGIGDVEWASPSGGVFIVDQGNGKSTESSQDVTGPDGRTAVVVISGGQVTATIPLPAWAASSPLFDGGDTAIGW
jgi:hypothetical protein